MSPITYDQGDQLTPAETADIILPAPQQHNDADLALSIANEARNRWNSNKQAEVQQSRQFSQMAAELADAIITHLRTVPRPVAVMVARKVYNDIR